MVDDEFYMKRAFELAERGRGLTMPNPMVGAVLVKDGKIIGEGYHQQYGGPHAEAHALDAAGSSAKGSTLYVTLEPCSHHGKTPPCCEAVAKAGVKRVVCAISDPNPLVKGKGLAYLEKNDIQTSCGMLEEQAEKQNEIFLHFMRTKTPFVILKTAMSLDGKIATKTGESRWITSKEAREYVHHLRSSIEAIMVGVGTVLADDPLLTVRTEAGRNPIRIIMDSTGRTPLDGRLFQSISEAPLIIVGTSAMRTERQQAYQDLGAEVLIVPAPGYVQFVRQTLQALAGKGITSVLLEGGGTLSESFIRSASVQKLVTFIAPTVIGGIDARTPVEGEGVLHLAEASQFEITRVERIGCDVMIESRPRKEVVCSQD